MANGYVVYRSTKKNSGYKKIATVKKPTYVQKKLKKETYYYKVKAYQNAGKSKVYTKLSSYKKAVIKK